MNKAFLVAIVTLLFAVVIVIWHLADKPCPTLLFQDFTIPMDTNLPSSVTTSPIIIPSLQRRPTTIPLSVVGAPLSSIFL